MLKLKLSIVKCGIMGVIFTILNIIESAVQISKQNFKETFTNESATAIRIIKKYKLS